MTEPDGILVWDRLSESARSTLNRIAILLAARFTGQIQLDCNEGGVKALTESRRHHPRDLDVDSGRTLR